MGELRIGRVLHHCCLSLQHSVNVRYPDSQVKSTQSKITTNVLFLILSHLCDEKPPLLHNLCVYYMCHAILGLTSWVVRRAM